MIVLYKKSSLVVNSNFWDVEIFGSEFQEGFNCIWIKFLSEYVVSCCEFVVEGVILVSCDFF